LPNDAFAKGPRQEQITAASRHFVALSAARMQEWMASDLSKLDLLVIQIDGIHMDEDLILVAAIGVDAKGDKHPLGLIEGATENVATAQAPHQQSRRARARPGGAAEEQEADCNHSAIMF
jgi:hypothetical protein